MTLPIIVMMITGLILIIVSFFVAESITSQEESYNLDLITIDESYEFSDRELRIIKRKIEDVIANHAKEILYETNDSLASMANEKTLALGDYAVTVCEEIEKNHKEVMFLYSMLDDKQKEIMNTARIVDEMNRQIKETLSKMQITVTAVNNSKKNAVEAPAEEKKTSALDQLSALAKRKKEAAALEEEEAPEPAMKRQASDTVQESGGEVQEPERGSAMKKQMLDTKAVPDVQSPVSEEETETEEVYTETNRQDEDFDEEFEEEFEEEFKENENSNDIILEMHRNGSSIIEIAKQLGLGVGEVKLVIDLYQGE